MTAQKCGMRNAECGIPNRRTVVLLGIAALVGLFGVGCRQKMAEQPYYKPLEPSGFFADGRSARPLEKGVVHRAQRLDSDPMVTGLTADEWSRYWKWDEKGSKSAPAVPKADAAAIDAAAREVAFGAPRFDQRKKAAGQNVYVEEFPFEITDADLRRGQERFSIYCAVCHGPVGNGKGKIWERGYLKPTSYHTVPVEPNEPAAKRDTAGKDIPKADWAKTPGTFYDLGGGEVPLGISRGYWRWGIEIPVREVPPGYVFEVISKGFGAMPDHASQIKPEDRWRIVAYVRTLQYSQHAKPEDLTAEPKKADGGHH